MHISKAQIAALVLGYLKSEKLTSVVEEFIRSSVYLRENNENIKVGKYFVTRVVGMTLSDILEQYSLIYAIVQGRLEETDYYECHTRTTLVEQLLYLLDDEPPTIASSTPVMNISEVEATPAHSLPGNSDYTDNDNSIPKTPKRRVTRSKSKEREEVIDMTEVLTQSLLENHELHEKIAETINIVRNTPDSSNTVTDEHISAGASKELDAVIKTVIQKTEEDPVYNKLIDEIIGTSSYENPSTKKNPPLSTPSSGLSIEDSSKSKSADEPMNNLSDPMDDHNNDAIRSIIEASQNSDPPPPPPPPPPLPETSLPPKPSESSAEVYLFDGSLDTYLKTSGAANSLNPNPGYFNSSLIVIPPPEPTKQYYIVNNQPLLKMNVPTVLTEKELMAMPTVIVNDEKTNQLRPKGSAQLVKKNKLIMPKNPDPEGAQKPASHVRNLDFSTPSCKNDVKGKKSKAWDSDLRELLEGCKDKSPSLKKKRQASCKKRKTKQEKEEEKALAERVEAGLMTPVKDIIPKTPEVVDPTVHYTPFNDVLDEQLKGVDLTSIPTPSIPITPGFALTPGDMLTCNNRRLTDYSTSSSYYQPSDTEQPKNIDQLIEECETIKPTSPILDKFSSLNILSDVIIEQAKVPETEPEAKKTPNDHLTKFNNNVIGKKNLSLIKHPTTSSSSSDSELESEKTPANKPKNASIKEIIDTVEVKTTLETDTKKNNFLSELDKVRQRTIKKIKNPTPKKQPKPRRKSTATRIPKATKRKPKKKETPEENTDEEAQKLVKGLAQRGIHLIPNKTPLKKPQLKKEPLPPLGEDMPFPFKRRSNADIEDLPHGFERKIYEDVEVAVYDDKSAKKKTPKTYNCSNLSRTMKANVSCGGEIEVHLLKWTLCECVMELTRTTDPLDDELMDYCVLGTESEPKTESKTGKKRKGKFSEDKQKEKRSKSSANHLQLLKKINVEEFLDKVHGE